MFQRVRVYVEYHSLPFWRLTALAVAFAICIPGLRAQGLVSNLSSKSDNADQTQMAIPGGAGAVVSSSGTAAAGPLIGFQIWQPDRFLLSSFFTFSPAQTISGSQRDFGALILNPPGQGTSYSFAGNKVLPVCGAFKIGGCTKAAASWFTGIGGRAGLSNSTWQTGTDTSATSIAGSVAYVTPALLVTSKTYIESDISSPTSNQYQFGFSVGPSFRYVTGDLAQSGNDAFRKQLLGSTTTSLHGIEAEFFIRMNSFRPYFRYTHFSLPGGAQVPGLSGGQVVFGVDVLSSIFQKTLQ